MPGHGNAGHGRAMLIGWFHAYAQQSSPNQIIWLNKIVIRPTPEPPAALLLAGGLGAVGLEMRRRGRASAE